MRLRSRETLLDVEHLPLEMLELVPDLAGEGRTQGLLAKERGNRGFGACDVGLQLRLSGGWEVLACRIVTPSVERTARDAECVRRR
ncbi:MAG: hypothetical protein ACRD2X_27825 [Vicinamibacteraceae bacterium]